MKKGSIKKYLIALLLAIIMVYALGAFYYSSHFSHNTIINRIDVGGLTPEQAAKSIAQNTREYHLKLLEKDDTEVINGEDIDLSFDMTNDVYKIFKKDNPFLWPKNLFVKKKSSVMGHVSYDHNLLEQSIDSLHCLDEMVKPKDAYIKVGAEEYSIVPEEEGTAINKKNLTAAIEDAIDNFNDELDFEQAELYVKAKVTKDDETLVTACNTANQYAKAKIIYLPKTQEKTLDFTTTKDWILLSKDSKVSLDKEKIKAYVEELAQAFNNEEGIITFTKHNGDDTTFQDSSFVRTVDTEKEEEAIINNIKTGQEVKREPVYTQDAEGSAIGSDIGKTYAEVSLDDGHVWLYKEGYVLSEANVRIGNINTGIFMVKSVDDKKIAFDEERGFVIGSGNLEEATTQAEKTTQASTEKKEETEEIGFGNEAEEETTTQEEKTTETVSDNVECSKEFYQNLKDTLKENIPVVVY